MPLLILTGFPSSGKTTIAKRIRNYLNSKDVSNVHILDDYVDSEFNRIVSQFTDKRRRYELFTIAKNFRTTFGIVLCDADQETALWLNKSRADPYPKELMEDLLARFERPNPRLSGEKPLFEVRVHKGSEDDLDVLPETLPMDMEGLYEWFLKSQPLKQNTSSNPVQKTPTTFIHEVDKLTQQVVKQVLDSQGHVGIGGYVTFPWSPDTKLQIRQQVSMPTLMRLRNQFHDLTRKNMIRPGSCVTKLFVEFLDSALR